MATSNITSFASLALTTAVAVIEPSAGVPALIAYIVAFGSAVISDHESDTREDSLERRVTALEKARIPTITLTGNPLRLLGCCLALESTEIFRYLGADEAIAELKITSLEYREAAEELKALGLLTIAGNANHASGIARTCLRPIAFLSAAPVLLTDINLPDEMRKLFDVIRSAPKDQYLYPVTEILRLTKIPLPRLDLMLRALIEQGVLEGHGMGSDEWGSYMSVKITPKGRRVLRGEDSL